MAHFSVTVVIPVWNQWQMTKACLESLKPTLGVHDNVVVVDNGSEDGTAKGLEQFPWITLITNETNLGFAKACNQGAEVSTGDIIVFLNNDTLVPPRWLDGLVEPFSDESVFASGPRSNFVSGLQLVPQVPYSTGSMSELRRFAKQWREEHRGLTSEVDRLIGFCLAVRRRAFEEIGGFDEGFGIGGFEDDDICVRLRNAGGKLLICHESFVHHHGHATFEANGIDWFAIQQDNQSRFLSKHARHDSTKRSHNGPLLSACMIVKDEVDNLPACLSSLNQVVDEVVIYDTGSTDGSIELARAAGATVIEGYWDDDFSRARNEALEACNSEWVLHIDADETFDGSAQKLRDTLVNTFITAFQLDILNLTEGNKNNLTHRPMRIFRREQYHWVGRLHEQVTMRSGQPRGEFGIIEGARLVHTGYLPAAMESKKKAERNIRIAQADNDADNGRDPADKLSNLGRSYTLIGNNEEGLALFTQARAMGSDSPVIRRTYLRSGIQAVLAVGRPEEALDWCDELDADSSLPDTADYFRAMAYADLGKWDKVLDYTGKLGEQIRDDDGVVFPMWVADVKRAVAFAQLERWDEAADACTIIATADTHDEPIWALVADSYWRAGRDFDMLFGGIAPKHLPAVFAQLANAAADAVDAALESLWKFEDRRTKVLALSIRTAPHLSPERALVWSERLRQVSMAEHCPLIAQAFDTYTPHDRRLIATAVAHLAFGDERALGALRIIAGSYPTDDFAGALARLNDIDPTLLETFVVAATIDGDRSFAMARVLHDFGAGDEAVAVLRHGLMGAVTPRLVDDAAAWLDSIGRSADAAGVRNTASR